MAKRLVIRGSLDGEEDMPSNRKEVDSRRTVGLGLRSPLRETSCQNYQLSGILDLFALRCISIRGCVLLCVMYRGVQVLSAVQFSVPVVIYS